MQEPTRHDWVRLGELLTQRRKDLGHEKRLPFARENGLSHDRTLSDLENARRTTFEAATIEQVERIYHWEPGSIRLILNGGDPVPTAGPGDVVAHDSQILAMLAPEIIEEIEGMDAADRAQVLAAARLSALQTWREIRRSGEQR